MATPAFLRYLPARLKPLGSPLVWAPLTVFCLLSVFAWEYRRNPNWSNRQPVPELEADADSADLTPEERASLSEIDTLDVLLDGARLSGGNAEPAASASEPSTGDSNQLTGRSDPFGVYTREYAFPGASAATSGSSTQPATPSASALPSPIRLNSTLPETASPATSSALSDALDRQQSAQAPSGSSSSEGTGVAAGSQPESRASGSQEQPTQAVGAQAAGSSIPVPYIRTTPNMSPPVGTTGYRPPATSTLPVFNQPLPQLSRNPNSAAPAAPAVQPASLPGASSSQSGVSYTPPSFTQPEQTRRVR